MSKAIKLIKVEMHISASPSQFSKPSALFEFANKAEKKLDGSLGEYCCATPFSNVVNSGGSG